MKLRVKLMCINVQERFKGTVWTFTPVKFSDKEDLNGNIPWNATRGSNFKMQVDKDNYKGIHPIIGGEYYFDLCQLLTPLNGEVRDEIKKEIEEKFKG